MVLKRYPNGADEPFFFQKRIPGPHPEWVETCEIEHASGNRIRFPMIQDLASLLWVANLGCIDLNQWSATCDDLDRPDYLHFDLDPGPDATFQQVLESALAARSSFSELKIPSYPKTGGSRGIHIYVPIRRGPTQKQVWSFTKELARSLAARFPKLITAEYRVAKRPARHVLVDYNQNAWGRTLASVYSARPMPGATVSTPVGWDEIERGINMEDFRIDNVPDRCIEPEIYSIRCCCSGDACDWSSSCEVEGAQTALCDVRTPPNYAKKPSGAIIRHVKAHGKDLA